MDVSLTTYAYDIAMIRLVDTWQVFVQGAGEKSPPPHGNSLALTDGFHSLLVRFFLEILMARDH